MEMNLRDWLVILGVLVVLGVLADGLRRIWLARRRANELNFGLEDVQGQGDDYGSELPNGGARLRDGDITVDEQTEAVSAEREEIVKRKEPFIAMASEPDIEAELVSQPRVVKKSQVSTEPASDVSDTHKAAADRGDMGKESGIVEGKPVPVSKRGRDTDPSVLPGQQALALDEPVPVLMELEEEPVEDVEPVKPKVQPEIQASRDSDAFISAAAPVSHKASVRETAIVAERDVAIENDYPEEQSRLSREPKEEVLVINVVAEEGKPYSGDRLLALFQEEGLRFGDMNIFHRHVQEDGTGQVLFSVANGVEPGTFNLRTMDRSYTPILSFFLGLPGPENPQQAFRIMVECVDNLVREMGGSLKDEQHSVLKYQTIEHYRQRICDFERRHLAPRRESTARA